MTISLVPLLVLSGLPAVPAGAQTGNPSDVARAKAAFQQQQQKVTDLRAQAEEAEAQHQARLADESEILKRQLQDRRQ